MPAPDSAVAHPPGASTGSSPGPTQNSNQFATESPCSIPNEGVKTEKASAPGKKKGKKIRRSLYTENPDAVEAKKRRIEDRENSFGKRKRENEINDVSKATCLTTTSTL